jgi:hypothetical protein
MERIRVASTTIVSVGYDPESALLEVEYVKSGVYRYYLVPAHVYDELLCAPSIGAYLNTHIKPRYSYEKV